jgi:putative MATE family efflux protein
MASNNNDLVKKSILHGRLGTMSLSRQVAVLAIWPLLENILAFVVGITDLVISSRMAIGESRVALLDAMGLGGYVAWFFNILQGAVGVGVMALVSRAYGARDMILAKKGLGQGLWLGITAGVCSFFILQLGISFLIKLIGLSTEAGFYANQYLRILAWSAPFSGALVAINAALRGAGDTKTPFNSMIVVNIVNIILSATFVFGPGCLGGHGVSGIAWGTVLGWIAGLSTVVFVLAKRNGIDQFLLCWTRQTLLFHRETMMRIIRIGFPQSLEIAGMWGIHFFGIQTISKYLAHGALGAHIIAIRVESMSFMPGFAIATAAAALTGQYLGAGSKEMAVKVVRFCWRLNVMIMSMIGLCFVIFRESFVKFLAGDSLEHLQLATPLLVVCAFSQPAFATCILLKTTMRGAGATSMVMKYAFSIMIFFRVGVLWYLTSRGGLTLIQVWILFGVDLFVQAAAFSWLHFRGKWLQAQV